MNDSGEQSDQQKMVEALRDVGAAFLGRFSFLQEIQTQVIPLILKGKDVLVCAPTASGKTEAILAPLIRKIRLTPLETARTGPHLLAIAPTRALVNDLLRRIQTPCNAIGWRVGAQTSDHRGAETEPDLLITTPESFDSMLVRRSIFVGDTFVGHLLAGVRAVFMDEVHCFDGTVRGDQLRFLMERLHRLRLVAHEKGWTPSSAIQVCGASATVPDGRGLAKRLLSGDAEAIVVSGGRRINLILTDSSAIKLDSTISPHELAEKLEIGVSSEIFAKRVVNSIREAESRKILIFVPSRSLCDSLAERLRAQVQSQIQAWVGAHHGSLSRSTREAAEEEFSVEGRMAVLVATSTLEVGIDIGDVDLIVLFGPPPDVSSLLQRVGRGGRRTGVIRLLPVLQDAEEAYSLASMLCAASNGVLDQGEQARHWGVFVQQIVSYIAQNRAAGRPASTLVDLAATIWPDVDTRLRAQRLITALIENAVLHEAGGRLHLDETLAKRTENWGGFQHSNIRSGTSLLAVRDNVSGEIIGHVSSLGESCSTTNVGGIAREIVRQQGDDVFVARGIPDGLREAASARYSSVPFEISRVYASHVARGIGLRVDEAPWVKKQDGSLIWFHFGGQIVQRILRKAHSNIFTATASAGIADKVFEPAVADYMHKLTNTTRIAELIRSIAITNPAGFKRSSFDDFIPSEIFSEVAVEVANPEQIAEFFRTRTVFTPTDRDLLKERLLGLI